MRATFALVLFALGTTGCAMCDNPYDYCGPVVAGGYSERVAHGHAASYEEPIYYESAPGNYGVPTPAAPPAHSTSFRGRSTQYR